MAEKLNGGDQFPGLTLQVGDNAIDVPIVKDSGYSIILFYRGHW